MPIKIPTNLPARTQLEKEGVMVMDDDEAARQDIRPLRFGLLNLMPNKQRTEVQFARLCGATPLQVEMTLVKMTNHTSKLTAPDHMLNFYEPFEAIREQKFDGFIVTGAPVELLDFEDVTYWRELQEVFNWCDTHVHSCVHICWGAQAALHHFHGVPKHDLPQKAFGVYRHRNLNRASPYLRGFSDDFSIPVSRWTEVRRQDIPTDRGLAGAPSTCSIILSMIQPRWLKSITAILQRVKPYKHHQITSLKTTLPEHRKIVGAATRTSCSATGSTKSTNLPPTKLKISANDTRRLQELDRQEPDDQ